MNVKVFFMALLMSMSAVLPSYSMDEENVVIILTEKTDQEVQRPRTGVPIAASIESGVITTETNTYSGTITVTIEDEDGETVLTTVENVSANSQFTTNVTSLADGAYTIYYTLDNNSVYYGEFEKN
jgi:hypothetical protein